MAYKLGDTIQENIMLYDTNSDPYLGAEVGDLVGASLKVNGVTDKTSLLALTEIGVTSPGEYILSFTPDVVGHWSLNYTEPVGTLEYHQRMTWEVLDAVLAGMAVADLYDRVKSHIQDEAAMIATGTDLNEAIMSAIVVFSSFEPLEDTVAYTAAAATSTLPLSTLTLYIAGFSSVLEMEYPVGESPPVYLHEEDDWWIARAVAGKQIVMYAELPAAAVVNISYTTLHALDGSTLSQWDITRVAFLAAGFALEKIAAKYLQSSNASAGAAIAEFRGRTDMAASRAREYMGLFYSFFGGDGKGLSAGVPPAVRRVNVTVERNERDFRPRLTHGV